MEHYKSKDCWLFYLIMILLWREFCMKSQRLIPGSEDIMKVSFSVRKAQSHFYPFPIPLTPPPCFEGGRGKGKG